MCCIAVQIYLMAKFTPATATQLNSTAQPG